MPVPSSFDYAIIRVVPRVEREEFMNAGVILFCRTERFLGALIELNTEPKPYPAYLYWQRRGRRHCSPEPIGTFSLACFTTQHYHSNVTCSFRHMQ